MPLGSVLGGGRLPLPHECGLKMNVGSKLYLPGCLPASPGVCGAPEEVAHRCLELSLCTVSGACPRHAGRSH